MWAVMKLERRGSKDGGNTIKRQASKRKETNEATLVELEGSQSFWLVIAIVVCVCLYVYSLVL